MKLYRVDYDGQEYYVEADSFSQAIDLWKRFVSVIWGADYDGTEEPESVTFIHDGPVVRAQQLANSVCIGHMQTGGGSSVTVSIKTDPEEAWQRLRQSQPEIDQRILDLAEFIANAPDDVEKST